MKLVLFYCNFMIKSSHPQCNGVRPRWWRSGYVGYPQLAVFRPFANQNEKNNKNSFGRKACATRTVEGEWHLEHLQFEEFLISYRLSPNHIFLS